MKILLNTSSQDIIGGPKGGGSAKEGDGSPWEGDQHLCQCLEWTHPLLQYTLHCLIP